MGFLLPQQRPEGTGHPSQPSNLFAVPGESERKSGLTHQARRAAGLLKRAISKQTLSQTTTELHRPVPNRPAPAPPLSPLPSTPRPPSSAGTYRISYDATSSDPRSSSAMNEQRRVNKIASGYAKVQAGNQKPAHGKTPFVPFEADDYWQVFNRQREHMQRAHNTSINTIAELPSSEPAWPLAMDGCTIGRTEHKNAQRRPAAVQRRPLNDATTNRYISRPTHPTAQRQKLHLEVGSSPHKISLDGRRDFHDKPIPKICGSSKKLTATALANQSLTSEYTAYNPQTAEQAETLAGIELRKIIDDTWSRPKVKVVVPPGQQTRSSAYTLSRDLEAPSRSNTETRAEERRSSDTTSMSQYSDESAKIMEAQEIKVHQARMVSVKPRKHHEVCLSRLAGPLPPGEPLPRWSSGGFRGFLGDFHHSNEYRRRKRHSRELEKIQRAWEDEFSGDLIDFHRDSGEVEKQRTTSSLLDFWENQK